jgi:unsaturated rhamnogalacturonyl hydrolase
MNKFFAAIVISCILALPSVGRDNTVRTPGHAAHAIVDRDDTVQAPMRAAHAIVDRVIRETSFDLHSVPLKPSLDIQVLDFGSIFGTSDGIAYARSVISVERDTSLLFGMSRDLPLQIRIGNAVIHTSDNRVPFVFNEIAYGVFRFNDTLRMPLKRGPNTILIKAKLISGRNVIYLREMVPAGRKPFAKFDAPIPGGGAAWGFDGVYESRAVASLTMPLPPDSALLNEYSYEGKKYVWRSPQPQYVQELQILPDAVYRRESYAEWAYPTGTVMLSLLEFARAAHDTAVNSFVRRFAAFTIDNRELFRRQYERLHDFRGTDHKLIRRGMLDDTGGPGLPFADLLMTTHARELEPIVFDVAKYIMDEQERLSDSTLCRSEPVPGTVWADDLFMSAPYMMRMGTIMGEQRYFDDAARQVVHFNNYLLDKATGLYRHGCFDFGRKQSPVAWGRANGWVIWATSEVLRFLPRQHPLRRKIEDIYRSHLRAIVSHQASSGLWHQVLDRPDTYEETSCSAMFIIGLSRGIQLGILDESYRQPLMKAWAGLQTRISPDGRVKDICRGTEIGNDVNFYNKRERFDNDPRGLGAVITACVEMMRTGVR